MGVSGELDKNVITTAARGDRQAFAIIVETYQRPVYNLALRMVHSREEAQDIAQEIFLHLLEVLERYDPERPFKPWLFRVATNFILNYLKRRRINAVSVESLRRSGEEGSRPVELPGLAPEAGEHIELSEKYEALHEAMAALPPDWRAVITLHYMQSYSVEEISSLLEVPVGTVKNRLFRARSALCEKLRRLFETWRKG